MKIEMNSVAASLISLYEVDYLGIKGFDFMCQLGNWCTQ